MKGRAFLDLARDLVKGTTEAYRRGAVIHAYYALVLECRDVLTRWGFAVPRLNMHGDVRLRFSYAANTDLREIGKYLDELVRRRNDASYDLRPLAAFASANQPQKLIQLATAGLALLDAIEGDPARRSAAVASIRP